MRLSDLIRGLTHILETRGDLPVMEERQVWYDSWEYFKDGIRLDDRVKKVMGHARDGKHVYEKPERPSVKLKDRWDFEAFVL